MIRPVPPVFGSITARAKNDGKTAMSPAELFLLDRDDCLWTLEPQKADTSPNVFVNATDPENESRIAEAMEQSGHFSDVVLSEE